LDQERKFFNFCSETMRKMENLKSKFQSIDNSYRRPSDNYNPLKYIRGSKLMDEGFINSNFPELDFSKNLKEWKDNEKSGKKAVLSYEEYLKKAKEERLSSNKVNENPSNFPQNPIKNVSEQKNSGKFSYEDYKKKLTMNSSTNNKNNPQDFSNQNNFGNSQNSNIEMDFNRITNNFSTGKNNPKINSVANSNLNPLNFDVNEAPISDNPYERINIDNLNLNPNNNLNYNFNNMNFAQNYGFNNFPQSNQGMNNNNFNHNFNNLNNNNNFNQTNNDFFNINNLNFPK
jgi:hypothetical protein